MMRTLQPKENTCKILNTLRVTILIWLLALTGITTLQAQTGTTWTSRTSAADNSWNSVTYGNGLYVAVSSSGTGNRVMTSPDGINWTSRTSAADNDWGDVTWGNGLYVAVASTGTGNRVMTSPDGITWTSRTSVADNSWGAVTYGNGLFVAVASTGTGNRVMTSPDGINWTSRTSAADNSWGSVTYGNGLFVAVSTTGTGNGVMTSPDGITWTTRTPATDNNWTSVTYGNGLFVAVSTSGTGDRVMTSSNGISWISRTSAADNNWRSVTYGNGLFIAVSSSGTGNRVMTSLSGAVWTSRTPAADNNWYGITYGNGLFVAVSTTGIGNRVMTSGSLSSGNTLIFNGTNESVSVNSTLGNFGTGIFTIEAWIRTSSATQVAVASKRNSPGFGNFIELSVSAGQVFFEVDGGSSADYTGLASNLTVNDGRWHHIAGVKSASTLTIYIDGVLDASGSFAGSPDVSNAANFIIGATGVPAAYFNGNIDEVRVYNTNLSLAQIQADMLSFASALPGNLKAYYNFDASSGTTLTDRSEGGNTGTLINSPNWVESYAMVVPTATAATGVAVTSFTANWTAPAIGTVDNNYRLDVSTSATFSSFVTGYNGLSVAGTSRSVTGLINGTPYYYRVRADKSSVPGQGCYSAKITATPISTNANLSALTTTAGTLNPVFASATIAYTASVANATTSVTVTPTVADATATVQVRVNGGTYASVTSGNASSALSLSVGSNTIEVTVTAQDGTTTKTYTITVVRTAAPPGNALNLDGTNDYVDILNPSILNFGPLTSYTVEAWVRFSASQTDYAGIVSKASAGGAQAGYQLAIVGNRLAGYVFGGSLVSVAAGLQGTTVLNDNRWHHVAMVVTRSTTNAKLYVDGVQEANVTNADLGNSNTNSGDLFLGKDRLSSIFFNGNIDEVRIWNVAKTQIELQTNMLNVISGATSNLVAYYNCDAGVAGGNNAAFNTLTDQTSYANNGILTNMALTGSTSNRIESYAMVVPVGTAATSVSSTGFIANWTAPAIGTVDNGYKLDVSTSSTFASLVTGYNGLSVVGTSQAVTGLISNTTYYYRVRADKTSVTGQGGNSANITTTTLLHSLDNAGLPSTTSRGAYSIRKLSSAYPGSPIKVRRTSDNAEATIAFDGTGKVSGTSIATVTAVGSSPLSLNSTLAFSSFYAGTNVIVMIWYDQSGYANDITQTVTASMPKIVNAGVLNLLNTKASLSFSGTSMDIPISSSLLNAQGSIAAVHLQTSLQANYSALLSWPVGISVGYGPLSSAGRFGLYSTNTPNSPISGNLSANLMYASNATWTASNTSVTESRNGVVATGSLTAFSGVGNGILGNNGNFFTGNVPEVLIFSTPLTLSDRQAMETNQFAYYASTNADLSALTTTAGTLTPTFAAATTAYTASVNNATTSVTITPTVADGTSSVQVRVNSGSYATVISGNASAALSLNVGSNTIDVKVTAQDGTTIKTYTITVTRVAMVPPGNALTFNGSNNYVEGTSSVLPLGNTARTMEAWIKPGVVQNGTIFNWGGSGGVNTRSGILYIGGYLFFVGESNDLQGTIALPVGKWSHVAATFDGATLNIYVNGILDGSAAKTLNTTGTTFRLGVASNNFAEYFNGSIDEVRIWNTALTQAQLQTNMFNTISASSPGLVAYYNFDNGTAGATNTGVTTLTDQTSNANNGALTNFALTGSTSNWVESYAMVVPTATAATNIAATSFTANWTAPAIGTVDNNYRLDVSISSTFASAISGSPFTVAGTSYSVTGLSQSTTYYYRVRADKTSVTGEGGNSNTINAAPSLVPLSFIKIEAAKEVTGANIRWEVGDPLDGKKYLVTRSSDGINFNEIGCVYGSNVPSYHFADSKPLVGINFYRIKAVAQSGHFVYSDIVKVLFEGAKPKFTVYPNPVTSNRFTVGFENHAAGLYDAALYDMQGHKIYNATFNNKGSLNKMEIVLPRSVAKGTYQLRITGADKVSNVSTLIIADNK